jgi:cytoskeleton protein RodZ
MTDTAFASLAHARQAAGLTLEQAARQLKFSARQLEALEAGELQRLPGGTFARGMVRSYARLLHVDPEPLLAQISAQVAPPDAERLAQRYSQPVPFTDGARRSNLAYVALSLALLVVVAAVALQWRQERTGARTLAFVSPARLPAEQAREEAASAVAPAAPTGAQPASKPVAAAAPSGKSNSATPPPAKSSAAGPTMASLPRDNAAVSKPLATAPSSSKAPAGTPVKPAAVAVAQSASAGAGTLALQFDGESWVEIRSGSGKLLVASLNAAGTERVVSGLPPFEIVIGNAQQVRLTYNDKPVDLTPFVKVEVARFTLP